MCIINRKQHKSGIALGCYARISESKPNEGSQIYYDATLNGHTRIGWSSHPCICRSYISTQSDRPDCLQTNLFSLFLPEMCTYQVPCQMGPRLCAVLAVSCIIGFSNGNRWKLLLKASTTSTASTEAFTTSMGADGSSHESCGSFHGSAGSFNSSFHGSTRGSFHNFHGSLRGSCFHESFHGFCRSFRGKAGVLPRKRFSQNLRAASMEASFTTSTETLKSTSVETRVSFH